MVQYVTIDLRRPAEDRWHLDAAQMRQARELLRLYKANLGTRTDLADFLGAAAKEVVSPEHWSEMKAMARLLNVSIDDVALSNFYYDALKVALGCTAFAVETESGILHARNLDWWTENNALAKYSCASQFEGAPAGSFTTVGWPGFIGVLSGIAPGRFCVTLNATMSSDPPQVATPVVLVLRSALEKAATFNQVLEILSATVIPCDCLLLLTGVRAGEMAVVERTPTRHAIRNSESGFICVTNDYKLLSSNPTEPGVGVVNHLMPAL